MKKSFFSLIFGLYLMNGFAQYDYRDSNRIGISFGVNQYSLITKNFETKPELGWNGGLSIRGNFYNNWDMVYAMQFSENNFSVATNKPFFSNEDCHAPAGNFAGHRAGAAVCGALSRRIGSGHRAAGREGVAR